jgi:eukaryotic-like serine/threonine-protein kinase
MIGRIFLGRYEALRLLGEGGMGKVYLARQLDLGRQVVIKVMHDHVAAEPKFRERFQRETLLMARFAHPYAVTLYDASLTDGPCIVMEYIRGVNLESLLVKNGRFTPARVGRLVAQMCEVLQAAHDQNLIHRDLKPANLMIVDHDSPREKIKVMDFGLAKLVDADAAAAAAADYHTSSAEFAVGTPGYICPEQVKGDPVDHRGDIYSVGVMMYELLTGRLPFVGPSSMDLMLAHATEMAPRFKDLHLPVAIPEPIEAVVFICMEKDPNDRPQTARELAELYETALAFDQSGLGESHTGPAHSIQFAIPQLIADPNSLAFTMEAWMPESIAVVKLQGFAHDADGQIVESIPGVVRMKLGPGGHHSRGQSSSSWFGFKKPEPLWLELHLHQLEPARGNKLIIQAVFRPQSMSQLSDAAWRDRCTRAYVDLRSYLMGTDE